MNNVNSEEKLAKAAYNWLRVSPLATIFTLMIVVNIDIGYLLCSGIFKTCWENYELQSYINYSIGVVISGLWHLILLQYVNNKDSAFVRKHGQQALIYAGVRTGVAFAGVWADFLLGASGALVCLVIAALFVLWLTLPSAGLEKIKKEIEADPNITRDSIPQQSITTEPTSISVTNENISNEAIGLTNEKVEEKAETQMENHSPQNNQEILDSILSGLQSTTDSDRRGAIEKLREINFSSTAIRSRLENMSLHDSNSVVRQEALKALSLSSNQTVQKVSSTLDRGVRFSILQEIKKWVSDGLLNEENAEVIQNRYNFDITPAPQPKPQPVPVPAKVVQPVAQPVAPVKPAEPTAPAPSLLQTLTSEGAIKIYLYLGAFFVVAAASFVGWAIPGLRLPILIIGTLLFGGFSIAIKKRLPQPSFALFIVFSFLFLITANNLEDVLQSTFKYPYFITSGYWVVTGLILTGIWGIGTRLYDSRFFSIAAFGAFVFAFWQIGGVFSARSEVYPLLVSIATFGGLVGVWLIKKWKDTSFALPLFLSAQLVQGITLFFSISIFGVKLVDPANPPLWNLIPFFVWSLGCVFILLSDRQYPFFAYPWLAAFTLIPLPWFLATALDVESLGSTIILFIWGAILSIASEAFNRFEGIRKFSLPLLIASFPAFALSLITGFNYQAWLGMGTALGIGVIFTALHILRTRWWLWTFALINFVIAYFAFFQLDLIKNLSIYLGYQILAIGLLFLIPDLFLKKDWNDSPEHRLPLRIFGVILSVAAVIFVFTENESSQAAVCFAILTLFTVAYAIAYQSTWLAYIPATTLPVTILYMLDAFKINDSWLPIFTGLTFLYFIVGIALRSKENWSMVLRNSALILASIIALVALINPEQSSGWYVIALGLLFIAEMIIRKNGAFEIGAPLFFSIGTFLILRDFNVEQISYHLLAYSLIWIFADLLAHWLYKHPRPLSILIRIAGGLLSLVNYLFLLNETNAIATTGFGIYTLLALTVSLFYRTPTFFYAFTLTLPLFVSFLFRTFGFTKWIHPVIIVALVYYAIGFVLRSLNRLKGWDLTLLYSGLGLSIFVSLASPILGGVDAAIPVAVAATLWAVEAFIKKNAWLAFPANGLYLMSYFILLSELNVQERQFYSIGAALLGLIQHYLLLRAESKVGAFLMGMASQFVLLGTTFIQMVAAIEVPMMFRYFVLLFFQSLVVLIYGIVIRSRSLTLFPIGFVVLGVITLSFIATGGLGTVFVVGCTGILFLGLGIAAVLLRERISKLGERLSGWNA
ncbi:MAG: hypothetical protein KF758_13500 [Anaerolineales bacterium]|nr:hypothetical protein [Anaerolineales bacterium]